MEFRRGRAFIPPRVGGLSYTFGVPVRPRARWDYAQRLGVVAQSARTKGVDSLSRNVEMTRLHSVVPNNGAQKAEAAHHRNDFGGV